MKNMHNMKRSLCFEPLEQRQMLSVPSLAINDITVKESAGVAQFTVSLSAPSNRTVTVNWQTQDGNSKSGSDFYYKAGTLKFQPGTTTKTINIPIVNDNVIEQPENFSVILTWPKKAVISDGTGRCTILDEDIPEPPTPIATTLNLSPTTTSGQANSTVTLAVSLSVASNMPISVQLDTAEGTAVAGTNYQNIAGQIVTFQPGQVTIPVSVQLLSAGESDTTFTVTASHLDGLGAILGANQTTITLTGAPTGGGQDPGGDIGDQIITPTELQGMISNPDVGYQTFYESALTDPNVKAGNVTSRVYYTRVEWSDIEKTLGVYDWTVIDQEFIAAKEAGQKFAFRVMPFEEGDSGPLAYKNAGLPGYSFTVSGTNTWVPDYNNPTVQSWMTKFIAAMGQRYGHDPMIDSVDIGMIGRWGEMHYYQCTPAPPMPTTATWQWLIDTFRTNFSVPILMASDPVETNLAAFQYATSHGVGWRDDGWSESWEMNTLLPQVLAAAPDAWKSAPVILEPSGTMKDTTAWRSALTWAVANHVSEFSNKSATIPASLLPSVQDLIAKLGYRFVLTKAQHASTAQAGSLFSLSLDWTNKGNAPLYQDRDILVKIGDKIMDLGHNMKGFLPGSRTDILQISTAGLAPGSYTIQIGLAAPGMTVPDIALAIEGGVDNWYSTGTVTII